jgi:hypothetical protein
MTSESIVNLIKRKEPSDEIWQEAIRLAEYLDREPDRVFAIAMKALSIAREADTLDALATCIIEHILERNFSYFDHIEKEINRGNGRMIYALAMCRKFGESRNDVNAQRWEDLLSANKKRLQRARQRYGDAQ